MTSDDGGPPHDPRAVLHSCRSAEPLGAAAQRVSDLLAVQMSWLRRRTVSAARQFGLEAEDLFQEVMVSLLRRTTSAVDELHVGVRTWLGRRVDFTAKDMVRARGSEVPAEPEELEMLEHTAAGGGRWLGVPRLDFVLDIYFLVERCELSPQEAQTITVQCAGTGMTLKEYAAAVGRSYAGVRKERERGIRKIENCLGLAPEEHEVMRMRHRHGSVDATAAAMDRSADYVRHHTDRATKKVISLFDGQEGTT